MHRYASVAGSGHGCRSSRIQRNDFPCSCGANECLPSNSATGSSAKSERSLGLERYLVKMSATFLSPPICLTTTFPSSILSCAHSVLVSRCVTFPKPFLVAIPFAAEESVDKVMLKSETHVLRNPLGPQGLTHALDYSVVLGFTARERHHGLCRSPSLQQVAPVHDLTSIGGPPCARAPSVVGVDVHLEVGLDILPCKPQHLSGVFPQVSHQLSNLGPV